MNLDLSHNNGPDTYTVSQNSPLFDLLDHTVETDSPAVALDTLSAWSTTIQHAVGDQVARCRTAGMSWQDIADTLGVSKQGAQQRYGA